MILAIVGLQGILCRQAAAIITNPSRTDGFGAQFQTIIYSVIFAELTGHHFIYTPFTSVEHNYNNDPNFIQKLENLINFFNHFEINKDEGFQYIQTKNGYDAHYFISFFENNLHECIKSQSLKKIKKIFRSNKKKENYFNNEKLNIAVHIRRQNSHDNRIDGTNTPDSIFIKIIQFLRDLYCSKNPQFHIYSQGDIEAFKKIFPEDDIVLHINESIEETFSAMVLADVLVTSRSSFSYTAGILSEGIVYYIPFWHPPLSNWIPLTF